MRNLGVLLLALSIAACSPPSNEPPALQCGTTQIIWEIDQSAFAQNYLERMEGDVRRILLRNDVGYRDLNAEDRVLRVNIRSQDDYAEASALFEAIPSEIDRDGNMTLKLHWEEDGWVEFSLTEEYIHMATTEATTRQIHILNRRLSELGSDSAPFQKLSDNQLYIVTGIDPPPTRHTIRHHWRAPRLEFRMLDESVPTSLALEGQIPVGSEILYSIDGVVTLVRQRSLIDQEWITDVRMPHTFPLRNPVVTVQLGFRGTQIQDRMPESYVGNTIAIVLDDVIIWRFSVPSRTNNGIIRLTGFSNEEEAEQIVQLLNARGMIWPMQVVSETIAPACEEE